MKQASQESTPQGGAPEPSPFCRHLRSKKYFFQTAPPRNEEELLDASKHCWCDTTQGQVGPDNEIVEHQDCRVGRECFEGLLGLKQVPFVNPT